MRQRPWGLAPVQLPTGSGAKERSKTISAEQPAGSSPRAMALWRGSTLRNLLWHTRHKRDCLLQALPHVPDMWHDPTSR